MSTQLQFRHWQARWRCTLPYVSLEQRSFGAVVAPVSCFVERHISKFVRSVDSPLPFTSNEEPGDFFGIASFLFRRKSLLLALAQLWNVSSVKISKYRQHKRAVPNSTFSHLFGLSDVVFYSDAVRGNIQLSLQCC